MTTSKVQVTEGSGKNLGTYSFSEDAVTKEVSRVAINDSAGVEIAASTGAKVNALRVLPEVVPFVVAGSARTRVSDTNAYAANDSISNSTTAGSVTALSATLSDTNDDPITVEEIYLDTTDTGAGGKSFRIWLYNSDPTASSGVVGGDNAAFSNKKAGFVGSFVGQLLAFSDGAGGRLVPEVGARLTTKPTSGAKTIYWQLQTLDAFTPVSASVWTPTFRGFQGRT